jgi:hypothetical protein
MAAEARGAFGLFYGVVVCSGRTYCILLFEPFVTVKLKLKDLRNVPKNCCYECQIETFCLIIIQLKESPCHFKALPGNQTLSIVIRIK